MRKVRLVRKSQPTMEGAGVHLRRAFGFSDTQALDPFLLFDDFRGDDPRAYEKGFPWHPHRGIETITYMLEGEVAHGDSLGNAGVIGPGGVQWMTAGSGIVHQEMPRGNAAGRMGGFQLWANLPAASKMIDPRYQELTAEQIPEVELGAGVRARLVCGKLGKQWGPVENVVIDPSFFDVRLEAGRRLSLPFPPSHTVIAYVYGGAGRFDDQTDPYAFDAQGEGYTDVERSCQLGDHTLVLYGEGEEIGVTAGDEGVRFLLFAGRPLEEPVAWYGPIVMNTRDELRVAFAELQAGTFLKHAKVG